MEYETEGRVLQEIAALRREIAALRNDIGFQKNDHRRFEENLRLIAQKLGIVI